MAQFRATIKGQRGEVSRLGSKASGIQARVNGWDVGILVNANHIDGQDTMELYSTGGSNARCFEQFIGEILLTPDGPIFKPAE